MSISEPPPYTPTIRGAPADNQVQLTVTADTPLTEISVFDGSFTLLSRAIGKIAIGLNPGPYKLRFRIGSSVQDELVYLSPEMDSYPVSGPYMEIFSPFPLDRHSMSAQQAQRLTDLARVPGKSLGHGGELVIFIRQQGEVNPTLSPPNASLLRPDGSLVDHLLLDGAGTRWGTEGWSGASTSLNPGYYFLRWTQQNGHQVDQPLFIQNGWQSSVTYLMSSVGAQMVGAIPENVAISYVELGARVSLESREVRWTEVARQRLLNGEKLPAIDRIGELDDTARRSPMLALFLHALSDHQYALVNNATISQFHDHPDVRALQLLATDTPFLRFSLPPMLRSSWDAVVNQSCTDISLVPLGSPSAVAAETIWGGGPWLQWLPSTSRRKHHIRSVLDITHLDIELYFRKLIRSLPGEFRIDAVGGTVGRGESAERLQRFAHGARLTTLELHLLDFALWHSRAVNSRTASALDATNIGSRESLRDTLVTKSGVPSSVIGAHLFTLRRKVAEYTRRSGS